MQQAGIVTWVDFQPPFGMTHFGDRPEAMTRHLLVYFTHVDDLSPNKTN
jgi:hypothetical protein